MAQEFRASLRKKQSLTDVVDGTDAEGKAVARLAQMATLIAMSVKDRPWLLSRLTWPSTRPPLRDP